jgi:hypothetical protein
LLLFVGRVLLLKRWSLELVRIYIYKRSCALCSSFDDVSLLGTGPVFGLIMVIIFSVQHLFFYTLEWLFPREDIDYVPIDLSLDKEDSTD